MHALIQDVRFAIRQLRKSPGFALTAMLTLAAGIASTCVVFSIVDAVLLRPLVFPDSDRLVSISSLRTAPGVSGVSAGAPVVERDISYPNFNDWRAESKSFQSLLAYQANGYTLTDRAGGPSQRVLGGVVSSEFLATLGVAPALGRGFVREEERAGNRSVILSHGLWMSQFAGAADVLGRRIRLSDEDYTVIGVMGSGFQYPVDASDVQFWVTPAHDLEGTNASAMQRGWSQFEIIGRLRDGVALDQASAEMNAIQKRLAAAYPDDNKNEAAASLVSMRTELVGDVRQPLSILFGAVSFLLLIACANVAGLLLARANHRRSEISIRASLGASRLRILRQVMVESMCLAFGGGVAGLGVAAIVLAMAPRYLPADLPRAHDVALNGSVAAFAFGLSLLTGLIFGILPAWRISRLDPAIALRDGTRGATSGKAQHRLQRMLVVAETAVGLVLLIGAGLVLRSFDRMLHADPGFTPDHLLTFRIAMPEKSYSSAQRTAFFDRLLPQLEALPGVQSATGAFPLPLSGGNIHLGFSIVGQKTAPGDEPSARLSLVQAKFFETLRIPLLAGRFFNADDQRGAAAQVMIVNQAFARRYFPNTGAVGQHVQTDVGLTDVAPVREIVGVVADVKRSSLTEDSEPEYYVPIEQGPLAPPTIAMRVAGDPVSYEAQVRALVTHMDASLPVYRVSTYKEFLSRLTAQQRFEAVLLSGFAVVALLLSAVGLYGVLSYMVSQRTREIGLRIALGAQRGSVQRQFLMQGVSLAVVGLLIGGAAAALLTRFIATLLYGVGRFDAATFIGTTLLLLVVSCVASLAPAYRASRLEPMQALRSE